MDEEFEQGGAEVIASLAEENQTRKILEILAECKDLDEARAKVRALLPA